MKEFYKFLLFSFIILQFLIKNDVNGFDDNLITVTKNDIVHYFVSHDPQTDYFVRYIFQNWENETFDVFEQVKDNKSIAIDIGAWIGTTSIWLSKNFQHVIAVEADNESLNCLTKNLNASKCDNVSIVAQPVLDISKNIYFGPRGCRLNESISYIKDHSDSIHDYTVRSITFKQLIHDYVYENEALKDSKISFIKCDIEGGEENILEDVLYFAYNNNCKVYMSFHLSWWKEKNIDDFAYLFKHFKTNCPQDDVLDYLKRNPFGSLLFEPVENDIIIKKNISVVVIGYNQYTFIKNMVEQLEKFTSDIIVVDNNSNYQPLLDYYRDDFKYTLLKKNFNYGYTVYRQKFVQDLVGDFYILTDPDLKFNPQLPSTLVNDFIEISNYFEVNRVGFALLIKADDLRKDAIFKNQTIEQWEGPYWVNQMHYPKNSNFELYNAPLDTTFCLINRKFKDGSIRVAGDYTCVHIPWHINFQKQLLEDEYESYMINNNSSNWYIKKDI